MLSLRNLARSVDNSQLTQKNTPIEWTDKQERCFQELKSRFVLAPILALLTGADRFIIYSDALYNGLGYVLMQNGKVIAYAS